MRILLHIGSPKTGTSALQEAFTAHREELLAAGYLYPSLENQPHHHPLALFVRPDDPPRMYRQKGVPHPARVRARGERALATIEAQVAEARPHTVILSSESLFEGNVTLERGSELVARLGMISSEIELVCYLRDPVSYQLSYLGQKLKSTHVLPASLPAPKYLSAIDYYAGAKHLHVLKYSRNALSSGDIVADFCARFVPERKELRGSPDSNPSLSAEGIDILWSYRRFMNSDQPDIFTRDSGAVYRHLVEAERTVPGRAPLTARPWVAEGIVDDFAPQAAALADRYGIRFSPVTDRNNTPKHIEVPGDVYVIDVARRDHLEATLLQRLVGLIPPTA